MLYLKIAKLNLVIVYIEISMVLWLKFFYHADALIAPGSKKRGGTVVNEIEPASRGRDDIKGAWPMSNGVTSIKGVGTTSRGWKQHQGGGSGSKDVIFLTKKTKTPWLPSLSVEGASNEGRRFIHPMSFKFPA